MWIYSAKVSFLPSAMAALSLRTGSVKLSKRFPPQPPTNQSDLQLPEQKFPSPRHASISAHDSPSMFMSSSPPGREAGGEMLSFAGEKKSEVQERGLTQVNGLRGYAG
jgi:hypothetical protein